MISPEFSYWVRHTNNKTNSTVSGYCKTSKVPSHGVIKTHPLPVDLEITCENDIYRIYSPPIICTKKAYRYYCVITKEEYENPGLIEIDQLDRKLSVFSCEAPIRGANRENWWGYILSRYHSWQHESGPAPVSLMKKWKAPILDFILTNHPERSNILSAWATRISNHNDCVKRHNKHRPKPQKKQHNDLVVLLEPNTSFSTGPIQFFRFEINQSFAYGRNQHGLYSQGFRYKIPHSSAIPIQNAIKTPRQWAPETMLTLALLCWIRADKSSNHQIIQNKFQYLPIVKKSLNEIQKNQQSPITLSAALTGLKHHAQIYLNNDDTKIINAEKQYLQQIVDLVIVVLTAHIQLRNHYDGINSLLIDNETVKQVLDTTLSQLNATF